MVKNVVLLARVDDYLASATLGSFTTTVPVEHEPHQTPATIAEMALELAPPVKEWSRY